MYYLLIFFIKGCFLFLKANVGLKDIQVTRWSLIIRALGSVFIKFPSLLRVCMYLGFILTWAVKIGFISDLEFK